MKNINFSFRVLRANGRIVLLVSEELHGIFQKAEEFTTSNTKLPKTGTIETDIPKSVAPTDIQLKGTLHNDVTDSNAKDIPYSELDIQSKGSLKTASNKPDPVCFYEEFEIKSHEVKGQEFIGGQGLSDQQKRTDVQSYKDNTDNELSLIASTSCATGKSSDQNQDDVVNFLSVLNLFEFESDHYIKLGETNSYIIVLKIKDKN